MSSSALDTLLETEQSGGTLESCGAFTLSNRQALEKLAAYTLPRAAAWILRIVQAAVSGGADRLQIARSRHTVRFGFAPKANWSRAVFEATFFDAGVCPDAGLDAFKRALWHKGLHERRPFRLLLPHERYALVWDGRQLHQQKVQQTVAWVQLTVSHQPQVWSRDDTYQTGYSIDAINEALGTELRRYAHACPIELQLEGVRIDRLQHTLVRPQPSHALPLGLIALNPDLPPQPVPPATLEPSAPLPGEPPEQLQTWGDVAYATACCLVSLNLRPAQAGQGYRGFQMGAHSGRLHWVHHGVIIGEERLPFEPRALALDIYASAANLDTDVSGLHLVEGQPEQIRRRRAVGLALQTGLPHIPCSLAGSYSRSRKRVATSSAVFGGGTAGCFAWLLLPATSTLMLPVAASAVGAVLAREFSLRAEVHRQMAFENAFRGERQLMENDWSTARPASW